MNKQQICLIVIFSILFFIPTSSAAVTNGGFETGNTNGWLHGPPVDQGNYSTNSTYAYSGNYGLQFTITPGKRIYIYQDTDLTDKNTLSFRLKRISLPGYTEFKVKIGGVGCYTTSSTSSTYSMVYIDVSEQTGSNQIVFELKNGTGEIWLDDISVDVPAEYILSGYATNNLGNSVSAATITLNNSGGTTNSNDTGYYEITGISSGTYSITSTSPTHQDYSDTVSISTDTEKNISMTRLSPVLTWTDAETTMNDVFLKWRRNIVVDKVRIYKDTETRLLTTVSSGSTLAGLYSDRNLDCDKGYVYWLQPMDNDIAGPKYRIDAKTDPCDGGGGGGGDPTPTPSPTATPGPTPPPWTNITPEEWLNLTLDQKQEILANLTMFPPLLEFQWEDIYVWGIHLFLILCGAVALDSITIQKVSEYTGLWAILPGVMFAYLTGYLVI